MAYLTNAELKTALTVRLKRNDSVDLYTEAPHWEQMVEDANLQAYNTVRSVMAGRGYALADIDLWDRRVEFNRRLALCTLFREGAMIDENIDTTKLDLMCKCEEELTTVLLTIDGVIIEPDVGNANISFGVIEYPEDAQFTDETTF